MNGPTLVVDVETTGFHVEPPEGHSGRFVPARVIELGGALVHQGRIRSLFSTLVVPEPITTLYTAEAAEARKVHRIDPVLVQQEGRGQQEAADQLQGWLQRTQARHGVLELTAYNLEFEERFLRGEPWDVGLMAGECLMKRAARLMGCERWVKLEEALEWFRWKGYRDCQIRGTHRARADVEAAAHMLLAMQHMEAGHSGRYEEERSR